MEASGRAPRPQSGCLCVWVSPWTPRRPGGGSVSWATCFAGLALGIPRATRRTRQAAFKSRLGDKVKEVQAAHPGAKVTLWSMDEHRVGLKPILRRVWTRKGTHPIALGWHRFKPSPTPSALEQSTASLSSSTAQAGTHRRSSSLPTASTSTTCHPTHPSCNPPKGSGASRTNPWSTRPSRLSTISGTSSTADVQTSRPAKPRSKAGPSFTGGPSLATPPFTKIRYEAAQ